MFFSGAYTVYAAVVYLLGAILVVAKGGLHTPAVFLFYLVAPVLAGTVVGAMRPLLGRTIGRLLVGAVAGIPVSFCAYLVVLPADQWSDDLLPLTVFSAVVVGPLAALAYSVDD